MLSSYVGWGLGFGKVIPARFTGIEVEVVANHGFKVGVKALGRWNTRDHPTSGLQIGPWAPWWS